MYRLDRDAGERQNVMDLEVARRILGESPLKDVVPGALKTKPLSPEQIERLRSLGYIGRSP